MPLPYGSKKKTGLFFSILSIFTILYCSSAQAQESLVHQLISCLKQENSSPWDEGVMAGVCEAAPASDIKKISVHFNNLRPILDPVLSREFQESIYEKIMADSTWSLAFQNTLHEKSHDSYSGVVDSLCDSFDFHEACFPEVKSQMNQLAKGYQNSLSPLQQHTDEEMANTINSGIKVLNSVLAQVKFNTDYREELVVHAGVVGISQPVLPKRSQDALLYYSYLLDQQSSQNLGVFMQTETLQKKIGKERYFISKNTLDQFNHDDRPKNMLDTLGAWLSSADRNFESAFSRDYYSEGLNISPSRNGPSTYSFAPHAYVTADDIRQAREEIKSKIIQGAHHANQIISQSERPYDQTEALLRDFHIRDLIKLNPGVAGEVLAANPQFLNLACDEMNAIDKMEKNQTRFLARGSSVLAVLLALATGPEGGLAVKGALTRFGAAGGSYIIARDGLQLLQTKQDYERIEESFWTNMKPKDRDAVSSALVDYQANLDRFKLDFAALGAALLIPAAKMFR